MNDLSITLFFIVKVLGTAIAAMAVFIVWVIKYLLKNQEKNTSAFVELKGAITILNTTCERIGAVSEKTHDHVSKGKA